MIRRGNFICEQQHTAQRWNRLCDSCCSGMFLNFAHVGASLEEDVTGSTPVSAPRVADNLKYKDKLLH